MLILTTQVSLRCQHNTKHVSKARCVSQLCVMLAVSNATSLMISASYLESRLPRVQFAALTPSLGLTCHSLYGEAPAHSRDLICWLSNSILLMMIACSSAFLVRVLFIWLLAVILSGQSYRSIWASFCSTGKFCLGYQTYLQSQQFCITTSVWQDMSSIQRPG